MKRIRLWAAALFALLAVQPALAQDIVSYRAADGLNRVDVSTATPLPVTSASGTTTASALTSIDGKTIASSVSAPNSSSATLGSGAVFTGTAVDVTSYSSVSVTAFANVASATDGLSIQQSSDGTNWDIVDSYTVSASAAKVIDVQIAGRFLRVVYTNGGSAQGAFRLQTILHAAMQPASSVRPQDGRTNETDTAEVSAFGFCYNAAGNWDRARSIAASDGTGLGVCAYAPAPHSNAAGGITPSVTSAVGSALVAKASAGNLYGWRVTSGASAGYRIEYYPPGGTVPSVVVDGNTLGLTWTINGAIALVWQILGLPGSPPTYP